MAKLFYVSIEHLIIDALFELPVWKEPFVSNFLKSRAYGSKGTYSADALMLQQFTPEFLKKFLKTDPEMFDKMIDFRNFLLYYWRRGFLPNFFFNRIFALGGILKDLINYMKKHNAEFPEFTTFQKFFKYAMQQDVPDEYLLHLSVIIVTEHAEYLLKTGYDIRNEMEGLKVIYHESFKYLFLVSKAITTKLSLDKSMKVSPSDVFIYSGRPYPIKWFNDDGTAKKIIFVGDTGTGKTIALLRSIYGALNQGYTVLVFGLDVRNEFRYAAYPLIAKDKPDLAYRLKVQNEVPTGLPITVYCESPKYPMEKDINAFKGTPYQWENLKGVVLFEAHMVRLISKFVEWRKESREKDIIIALNEAQHFTGSTATSREEFYLYDKSGKLFMDLRGFFAPVILNTQFLSRVQKKSRMADELFASYISLKDERRHVAQKFDISALEVFLARTELKREKVFLRIQENRFSKVKFLVPPCLTEIKTSLNTIVERHKKRVTA